MRLRVPAGGGAADLVKILSSSHDTLYARWYQKWEPGYDFSALTHGSGLLAGDRNYLGRSGIRPTGADFFLSSIESTAGKGSLDGRAHMYSYYRGMYQDCVDPNGQCWGDSFPCMWDEGQFYCTNPEHRESELPVKFQTGQWYCIEIMAEAGTPVQSAGLADGVESFWVDGVEYGPFTKLWHRTTANLKLSILWLNLYHHGSHSVEGTMLDNVVVSTQRIGCLAGGTGLAAPTNLRIVK